MKVRSQTIEGDGFDKNVAEKMPKIRRPEELPPSDFEGEPQWPREDHHEVTQEIPSPARPAERRDIFTPPKRDEKPKPNLDVLRLIEDLHTQLLVSTQTKKALEMDLTSHQKTIHQLAQDNKDLRGQLAELNKELQGINEVQYGSIYLKEENEDSLEKIRELQLELKDMKETLGRTFREKEEALSRVRELESQMEQKEILLIKGRLREREASHFYEENQTLQSRLEEALAQKMDLERRYETLRRSFNEVRESLTALRDSCRSNFYNLPESPESS